MTEMEQIEARIPSGMQMDVSQMDWEYQAALARRERSRHIAASLGKLTHRLSAFLAQLRGRAAVAQAGQLQQQP